ncbi:Methanol--corrinoid protein co-methyltransferase [Candidatus Methanobinarius endosymbioticus]|uniref:Methanol--corrinoid protein co-methyltransferase n=1 Tax=Candidatus Methanobinarius endosymbioticus TaxID=2006182 RepID=A0A366MB51_9EURY|nr:Methanol--corrinoid protein co-methyltransferase [Candidatus Methanobinarius endosymbioticus]
MKRFTQMEYKDPDELLFGHAKYPISIGNDTEIGAGHVIPEINVAPGEGTEESKEKMVSECRNITRSASDRAVNIGLPAFILEQEHISQQTNNPDWTAECTQAQVEVLEKYHDEYGIKTGLRATPADIRDEEKDSGFWSSDLFNRVIESIEASAENGAAIVSIETTGGKSVSDYGISRGDPKAILFGIGVLGSMDMEYMWEKIVPICKKHNTIPGGDTDCSQSNTAMFLAGGLLDKDCSHTLTALARAMGAARSLVAVECGAQGPLKDCGYENPIVKAISGVPISTEGKNAVCAHSDLMGNLMASVTDMWSNESVYHREEMGGTTPEVWLQATGYEAALMNTAIETGEGKTLRDLYTLTDKYRDPQALILAYDNAYRIGEAIVKNGDDPYLRARAAAIEAGAIINEAVDSKKMYLTRFERDSLDSALKVLKKLPTESDKFTKDCIRKYSRKVPDFDPKNYEL